MICDLCLGGRHVRCRGCDCGMCRLKKERRGTPKQASKKRQTGAKRRSSSGRSRSTNDRSRTAMQHSMVPDLYGMGLPYEDIVELLGIETDRPAAFVRRIMKTHEDKKVSA